MRANRNFFLALSIATTAHFAHAQYAPAPVSNGSANSPQAAGAVAAAPAALAASATTRPPSDTIGEAADRQRMARMLQSQAKTSAPNTPISIQQAGTQSPAVIGAINVERSQVSGPIANQRPTQPDMALVEIARGPKATIVAIQVSGVERRVAEGDDLGNGWKVKHVGRFAVELEEFTGKSNSGASENASSKTKAKTKANSSKKSLKTRTLELKSSAPTGDGDAARPVATR